MLQCQLLGVLHRQGATSLTAEPEVDLLRRLFQSRYERFTASYVRVTRSPLGRVTTRRLSAPS